MAANESMEQQCRTLLVGPGLPCVASFIAQIYRVSFKFYFWWFPKCLKILLVLDQNNKSSKRDSEL